MESTLLPSPLLSGLMVKLFERKFDLTTITPYYMLILTITAVFFVYYIIQKTLTSLFGYKKPDASTPVNILDVVVFDEFRPEWIVSNEEWKIMAKTRFNMTDEAIEFQSRMLSRSGISEVTHWPPGVSSDPPDFSIASARYEAEVIMFSCIDKLFKQNHINPRDIDVLVVNCSLFNPTPSLCAMIINKYQMRENIVTYNISGMGCSAGVLGIQLAADSLRRHPKRHPLGIVVSTEIITPNVYTGREKPFLLANSLFRMNGSAVLLTRDHKAVLGRPAPRWGITHLVRVHLGADDEAYECIIQKTDNDGMLGVKLEQSIMKVAQYGIQKNMTILAPLILPYHEQFRYVLRLAWSKLKQKFTRTGSQPSQRGNGDHQNPKSNNNKQDINDTLSKTDGNTPQTPRASQPSTAVDGTGTTGGGCDNDLKPKHPTTTTGSPNRADRPQRDVIIPSFKTAVDYFAIHAGGRGVLDGIQKALDLNDDDMLPSRNVLYKYGNTSSCSIFYELVEIENTKPVKSGQKLLALAIGSGFKCNTLVLTRL